MICGLRIGSTKSSLRENPYWTEISPGDSPIQRLTVQSTAPAGGGKLTKRWLEIHRTVTKTASTGGESCTGKCESVQSCAPNAE
jgi:hypothetical protein